jgi:hypothetical protein
MPGCERGDALNVDSREDVGPRVVKAKRCSAMSYVDLNYDDRNRTCILRITSHCVYALTG